MDRRAPGLYGLPDASYVIPPARSEEFVLALSRVLDESGADVLLPTVDEEIAALCREPVLSNLSELVSFLLPGQEAALKALDKYRTTFEARRHDLPVPKTVVVPSPSEAGPAAEEIGYPVVAKPSRSRGARGISYIGDEGQVEECWHRASAEGGQVLFQEFVPGPVFTVGTVCDGKGEIAASIVLVKTREVPATGGVAVSGRTVSNPELQELGERFVTCLDWRGPASVEIKHDERDGSYRLMEVNPRLFGYNYLAAVAGVNLAEVTVRLAMGEELEPRRSYREGLSFVRAPHDIIIEEEIGD
jgi:predicted ATP-grasp superfamily ATP-dependent carboligase